MDAGMVNVPGANGIGRSVPVYPKIYRFNSNVIRILFGSGASSLAIFTYTNIKSDNVQLRSQQEFWRVLNVYIGKDTLVGLNG